MKSLSLSLPLRQDIAARLSEDVDTLTPSEIGLVDSLSRLQPGSRGSIDQAFLRRTRPLWQAAAQQALESPDPGATMRLLDLCVSASPDPASPRRRNSRLALTDLDVDDAFAATFRPPTSDEDVTLQKAFARRFIDSIRASLEPRPGESDESRLQRVRRLVIKLETALVSNSHEALSIARLHEIALSSKFSPDVALAKLPALLTLPEFICPRTADPDKGVKLQAFKSVMACLTTNVEALSTLKLLYAMVAAYLEQHDDTEWAYLRDDMAARLEATDNQVSRTQSRYTQQDGENETAFAGEMSETLTLINELPDNDGLRTEWLKSYKEAQKSDRFEISERGMYRCRELAKHPRLRSRRCLQKKAEEEKFAERSQASLNDSALDSTTAPTLEHVWPPATVDELFQMFYKEQLKAFNKLFPIYKPGEVSTNDALASDALYLSEAVVNDLRAAVEPLLAERSMKAASSILFIGSLGVGKTSAAKKIAELTGRKFILLKGADLRSSNLTGGDQSLYFSKPSPLTQAILDNEADSPLLVVVDEIGDASDQVQRLVSMSLNGEAHTDRFFGDTVEFDISNVVFVMSCNPEDELLEKLKERCRVVNFGELSPGQKQLLLQREWRSAQATLGNEGFYLINLSPLHEETLLEYTRHHGGARGLMKDVQTLAAHVHGTQIRYPEDLHPYHIRKHVTGSYAVLAASPDGYSFIANVHLGRAREARHCNYRTAAEWQWGNTAWRFDMNKQYITLTHVGLEDDEEGPEQITGQHAVALLDSNHQPVMEWVARYQFTYGSSVFPWSDAKPKDDALSYPNSDAWIFRIAFTYARFLTLSGPRTFLRDGLKASLADS